MLEVGWPCCGKKTSRLEQMDIPDRTFHNLGALKSVALRQFLLFFFRLYMCCMYNDLIMVVLQT